MKIKKISKDMFVQTNWSGGKTEEIFIYPESAEYSKRNFDVRISTATVELERSAFTILPKTKRIITPLSGRLKLFELVNDKELKLACLKPFEFFNFSGETPIISYGVCRDFNIMTSEKFSAETFLLNSTQPKLELVSGELAFVFSYNVETSISVNDTVLKIEPMTFFLISEFKIPLVLKLQKPNSTKNLIVGSLKNKKLYN
ncbi:MAG: HutD family protein [Treponemataceae bacterium]